MEPTLVKLHPAPVTMEGKVLGIIKKNPTPGILLRNWITYSLRKYIMQREREEYHVPNNRPRIEMTKVKFNHIIAKELKIKMFQYKNQNQLDLLDKTVTYAAVLCENDGQGKYTFKKVFS